MTDPIKQAQAEALEREARAMETAPQRTPYARIDMRSIARALRQTARTLRQNRTPEHWEQDDD
ncbi:hypothetical protein [Thioalkalivibrio sp. ALJ8]|uniref:hypothetical protein n=1 Tax=Thioalkalivibrio sp. ALJ8 TaxID=1158757 RepID=UPI00035C6743|nr:hypothetical protein [Thioalkalivibrio sp. ALJ8]